MIVKKIKDYLKKKQPKLTNNLIKIRDDNALLKILRNFFLY